MTDRRRLVILIIANALLFALLWAALYLAPAADAMPCGETCVRITKPMPTATSVYVAPPVTEEPEPYPAPATETPGSDGYPAPEPTDEPEPEATHAPTATPPDPSKD